MTLEEKFAEMFPEYVAGSELLSPYWDLFEAGAEVTEQKMKCCGNCSHRHYWGNELGCNLDYDKEDECNHNNKKYWEFEKE